MSQNNLRGPEPTYEIDQIQLSGVTYDLRDRSAIHNLNGYWTSGQTQDAITAATNALAESIAEQGYQTSGDVQNAISGKADTTAVTQAISAAVSGKADTTAVTQSISEATSGKVDTSTYTAYTAATDAVLSGKANTSDVVTDLSDGKLSNQAIGVNITKDGSQTRHVVFVADSGLTATTGNLMLPHLSVDFNTVAAKSDIPSVSGYADSVMYNSTSKYVEFYHGGTGGTKVFEYDASPFLIDGMVQNVEIKDVTSGTSTVTCLVISFNTDAGKQDINIPISQIFDANNYYTKTEVDAALSAKSDSSAVTEEISAAVSGKVDNSTYTAYTAATDTVLGGKADTTAVTQAISEATSGKVDNSTYTAFTSSTDTALAGKANTGDVVTSVSGTVAQSGFNDTYLIISTTKGGVTTDTGIMKLGYGLYNVPNSNTVAVDNAVFQVKLVSGTNIKTVGGNSLLGSGDISFPGGMTASVDGTTLIFS